MKITFPCLIDGETYDLIATSTELTAFNERIWELRFADTLDLIDQMFFPDVVDAITTI